MKIISIIVPCYNEEESAPILYQEIQKLNTFFQEKELTYELIFVDDGSNDNTVEVIKQLHKKNEHVHLLAFSRHIGKDSAI